MYKQGSPENRLPRNNHATSSLDSRGGTTTPHTTNPKPRTYEISKLQNSLNDLDFTAGIASAGRRPRIVDPRERNSKGLDR